MKWLKYVKCKNIYLWLYLMGALKIRMVINEKYVTTFSFSSYVNFMPENVHILMLFGHVS